MSDQTTPRGPLEGITVLDLTIAMAGPLCTQRLAEMGAEVIKIEAPGKGDFSRHAPMAGVTKFGDATCYMTLNQQKKGLVLDLKSDQGRTVLHRLVRKADVLVQNFRPRVAAKLGIEYAALSKINPRIICGKISGYGEDGPMKDRPGQDLLLQSFAGLTMNGGRAGDLPRPSPLYMVDVTASHLLGQGVLAALVARANTGRGQEVSVTMLNAIMEMQCQEITTYAAAESPPVRGNSPQVSIYQEPPYGIYKCDTGFLAIAQADLDVLADALDLPNMSRFKADRPAQNDGQAVAAWRDAIYAHLAEKLETGTAQQWDAILAPLGIWCMVVNDYDAFLAHPQTQDCLSTRTHPIGGDYTAVAPAIRFSTVGPAIGPAPAFGADSRAVLERFGLQTNEINALVSSGTVTEAKS